MNLEYVIANGMNELCNLFNLAEFSKRAFFRFWIKYSFESKLSLAICLV